MLSGMVCTKDSILIRSWNYAKPCSSWRKKATLRSVELSSVVKFLLTFSSVEHGEGRAHQCSSRGIGDYSSGYCREAECNGCSSACQ
jgi:hypothetical protein